MAESGSNQEQINSQVLSDIQTQTILEDTEKVDEGPPVLTLRLQRPDRSEHRVKWTSDTVDNEFMGKKKSKCCCIYEKPKVFGESDSSSEGEEEDDHCTPNCRGHKKKCYQHKKGHCHGHKAGHDHSDLGHGHDHHHHHHHNGNASHDGAGPSSGC